MVNWNLLYLCYITKHLVNSILTRFRVLKYDQVMSVK